MEVPNAVPDLEPEKTTSPCKEPEHAEAQKGGLGCRVKLGVPFGGPYFQEYSIFGSILGSPYFGKLPYEL